ncbi:hypothetical protein D6T64_04630 [Cryobacterium melibiosiphilum]|uniref:site-specific DNA-methyltransferase (adenine-specific) n=1 Tax=Cryobacterium melibiosiphilum TaxID=995039 RepID=A0A3A5MJ83_9MICO|nr:DNA methyltransferase [Cryobacterium melibiosiphilum]RJT90210.1 hypothetical protein D6T64_04630 [Cryobacterium melibiosiphilum]
MTDDSWMDLVNAGDFRTLFLEKLFWNRPDLRPISVVVDDQDFTLTQIANYKGLRVWLCPVIPDRRTQRLIDREVRKISNERLLIFADDTVQEWRWLQSPDPQGVGQPHLALHRHVVGSANPALNQRLQMISIGMDEEVTLIDVLRRMRSAFDADRITKAFYDQFIAKQRDLSESIQGIDDDSDRDWYSALLMNRLMFIYFMQRKMFMDEDADYLRNRLNRLHAMAGDGKFFKFYRDFLIPMFHTGLGDHAHDFANDEVKALVGDIPYINGGIFAEHELESVNTIEVPDDIFVRIFDLFDRYQWHLDDSATSNGNEINPDVLGYIFEQFINQKQQGAYYTKEDVTHFMTSSTLVPVFLERLENQTGVNPWLYLSDDPDRYIWESLKYGAGIPLPVEIEAERQEQLRPSWGSAATSDAALPGETWWELEQRRANYRAVFDAAQNHQINSVDKAVTFNLDLENLAIDTIDRLNSPEQVMTAWRILQEIRVIDPTCGSGAFLFAALKILQPMYSAVLDSLERHLKTVSLPEGDALLARVHDHANQDYFILKHATLVNLYGVDIMKEAVEIARLRLFLKLVAAIDNKEQLEPLPDLDFNIKAGNALVGALDEDDIEMHSDDLFSAESSGQVRQSADRISKALERFRDAQENRNTSAVAASRAELRSLLRDVREEVNKQYHSAQGLNNKLDEWVESHVPFHWFIEFPAVMRNGGFDVVVGNPPYVQKSKITSYKYKGFATDALPDIYAPCTERAVQITRSDGRLSLILPVSSQFSSEFKPLRAVFEKRFKNLWVSTFAERPSRLFSVKVRSAILTAGGMGRMNALHTTLTHSWIEAYRPHLLATLTYTKRPDSLSSEGWIRLPNARIADLLGVLRKRGVLGESLVTRSITPVQYKKTATYYLSAYVDSPTTYSVKEQSVEPTLEGSLSFATEKDQLAASAILVSKLAFLWWNLTGDCFNVTKTTMVSVPFSLRATSPERLSEIAVLGELIREAMPTARSWDMNSGKYVGNYAVPELRELTNEVDLLMLAEAGMSDYWHDIEYSYFRMFKPTGLSATSVRELPFARS